MYVLIDICVDNQILLALFTKNGLQKEYRYEQQNTDLLFCFTELLNQASLTKRDILGIAVVLGNGRFSSTRVAVTVANTWGYAEHIPVVAVDYAPAYDYVAIANTLAAQVPGIPLTATYSAEPNIGKIQT